MKSKKSNKKQKRSIKKQKRSIKNRKKKSNVKKRRSSRITGIKRLNIYKDGMEGGSEETKEPSVGSPPAIVRRNDDAIVIAARRGDLDEVTRLYDDGVSLDSTDYIGFTALIAASDQGHSSIVDYLINILININNGAALDSRVRGGPTALMMAASNGKEKVLKQLISAGADLNVRSNNGNTALMRAVFYDRRSCLAQLLMERADDTIVNEDGETAFQMAVRKNRPYGVVDAWEGMKARNMNASKFFTVLNSAKAASAAPVSDDTTPLAAFSHVVPDAMEMMGDIMSFVTGPTSFDADMDPRFIDIKSDVYESFATGVIRAFNSIPEESDRNNKPIDFFLPFVNAGLSEPWSRERAIAMMKVLVKDRIRGYGRYLVPEVNPLRLTLSTLEYNEERDLVSLLPNADGRRKSVKKKQKRSKKVPPPSQKKSFRKQKKE